MEQIEPSVDSRHSGLCIHCGVLLNKLNASRDHVPSKCLLLLPPPAQSPKVWICKTCNNQFSIDEQYLAAFLGCVLSGSTEPSRQSIPAMKQILQENELLRLRIEKSRIEVRMPDGTMSCKWLPEIERINKVVIKNARGHAFFEYGEQIQGEPSSVWALPLMLLTNEQRADFEGSNSGPSFAAWPEVGSRMMTRVVTGQDLVDSWIVLQEGVYRYAVEQQERMLFKTVLYEYLATEVCWMN